MTLPPPVERFRTFALRDGPARVETLRIETSAWMRRPGMPRIPLSIRMWHRVGRAFVHDIRIGRNPLAVQLGLDAYVDGRGLMRVGSSTNVGPHFDQGALIALWAEALCFPSAWEVREDVRWEPVDDRTARLVVPGPEGEIPITVGFDPGSTCPISCAADRYKATGPKVGWVCSFHGWRRWPGGVLAPSRFRAQWADEPFPWIDIRTTDVRTNVPVEASLARGRRALTVLPRVRAAAAGSGPGD
jgi:hypothetical protein